MKRKLFIVVCVYALAVFSAAPTLGVVPLPPLNSMTAIEQPAKPVPRQPGVTWLTLAIIAVLVSTNISIAATLVFRDARRNIAAAHPEKWDDASYWRNLPNVLALIRQKRMTSPWPSHPSRWSVQRFESYLSRMVRPFLKDHTCHFVAQHLAVWAWVQSHPEAFNQFLRHHQIERALERLALTSDRDERLIIISFLNEARSTNCCTTPDKHIQRQLNRLERLHVILREHGYSVTPEFDDAQRLAQTPQEDIVTVLPHASNAFNVLKPALWRTHDQA